MVLATFSLAQIKYCAKYPNPGSFKRNTFTIAAVIYNQRIKRARLENLLDGQ